MLTNRNVVTGVVALAAIASSAVGACGSSHGRGRPRNKPVASSPSDQQRLAQVAALMTGLKRGTSLSAALALLKEYDVQDDYGVSAMNEGRYFIWPDIMVDFTLESNRDYQHPEANVIVGPPKVYRSPQHFN